MNKKIFKRTILIISIIIAILVLFIMGILIKQSLVDNKIKHFALITAMDIPNNSITVCNPYGYEEKYNVEEFLNATRYDSYENMQFYFKLAFAIGVFNKNTIYIVKNK